DPQTLNQYSYVRNIPASNADADGHGDAMTRYNQCQHDPSCRAMQSDNPDVEFAKRFVQAAKDLGSDIYNFFYEGLSRATRSMTSYAGATIRRTKTRAARAKTATIPTSRTRSRDAMRKADSFLSSLVKRSPVPPPRGRPSMRWAPPRTLKQSLARIGFPMAQSET